mmetsp:Transcript_10370/g.24702  ORF Transcript_10370/g.24702 Transcript_10370/m.24702 type:complete len:378 (+) Transcript_10370:197-1330(+)
MKSTETSSSSIEGVTTKGLPTGKATKSTDRIPFSGGTKANAIRNSLLAGSVAGIMSTVVCHPLDVLRVKMQSSAPAATAAATLSTNTSGSVGLVGTLRNTIQYGGGARALYTGLAMPLAAQALYKGTIFTVNSVTESFIRDWKTPKNNRHGHFDTPYKLTLSDRFISGFMGGAVNAALFCTPVEYIRNQQIAQIEKNSAAAESTKIAANNGQNSGPRSKTPGGAVNSLRRNGPISVIRNTIQSHGFTGLWRGMGSTILRDSVGCGFFFVAMAYSQEHLNPDHSNRPPSTSVVIFSGAMAGLSFWLWALPVDTMKTWIQNGTACNLSDAVRMSQHRGLLRSFPSLFRGWQVAYSRGVPSAAITVVTYSLASQHLQRLP